MKQIQLVAYLLLASFVGAASANESTVSIRMQQVSVHSGDRGQFYVIHVAIPADVQGKRLDSVMMEFAADATARTEEDSLETPVCGVFPLTQAYSGAGSTAGVAAAPAFKEIVPSSRPISLGEQHVLRMDITDIVEGWIDEPATNLGLVIGSLTGPEVGAVTLNDRLPGSESAIQITFFYQNRPGDSTSTRR